MGTGAPAFQIASDLRFAIRITNRNRSHLRDLEHLAPGSTKLDRPLPTTSWKGPAKGEDLGHQNPQEESTFSEPRRL